MSTTRLPGMVNAVRAAYLSANVPPPSLVQWLKW